MSDREVAAAASCFSITPFLSNLIHRSFVASGLHIQTMPIDDLTTLEFWAPKHTSPDKPNLLLVHGFGPVAMWQWRRQAVHFSPHFNVYVPNLVFFGGSFTKSAERSEFFQAKCVARLLEKLGVERFSAVGTSYGGFVSYNLARMFPERVQKLVIASSAVNMVKGDNVELAKRAQVDDSRALMLPSTVANFRKLTSLAVYKFPKAIPNFLFNDMLRNLYSEYRDEKMELLNGLSLVHNEAPKVSPIEQDVLLVWGDQDGIFPLPKAVELEKLLGGKAKLEVIKNAAHMPQVEKYDEFNKIVGKFLLGESS
uniref:AB hydrolase-1 domain-containing protein n=1 Tax=Kalanchoe fedtschenkoi TaxID=63787 RepID=A0A7N0SW68_KALFE